MMTKKEKRERMKQDKGIVDFMMVTNHFFPQIKGLDCRNGRF